MPNGRRSGERDRPIDALALEKYKILQSLALNEDRLFGERSVLFILASTLLITAFSLMAKEERALRLFVCLAGSLLTIFWLYVNSQAITAVRFWRSRIHLIEEELLGGERWGVHVARAKYYRGAVAVKMPDEPDIDGPLPGRPLKSLGTLFSTNKIILYGIPLVFFGLWIAFAALTIARAR